MIKIDTSATNTTVDLSSAISDTLYCYDSTYDSNNMNTGSLVTGSSNVFITNNTGTINSPYWNSINDTITLGNIPLTPLMVNGDATIEGNLTVGGKNIGEILDRIEERLAILHPNAELEDRWEELKELGRRYKELEQDIIEKEKIYNILKK